MLNHIVTYIKKRRDPLRKPASRAAFSAATCIGSRSGNQDTFRAGRAVACSPAAKEFFRSGTLAWSGTEMFCVCDGVGGACSGDAAARGALKAIRSYLAHADETLPLKTLALEAAEAAQRWVCDFYKRSGRKGGCTLVLLAVREKSYVFVNIGDSPGFLVSPDADILELSVRHNLAWEHRRAGLPAKAGEESKLLRYLGMPDMTAAQIAHVREGTVHPGYRFLLCSDGITNGVPPRCLETAALSGVPARQVAREAARQEDADNCTLVCVEILEQDI